MNTNRLEALIRVGRDIDAVGMPVVFSLAHLANLAMTLYSDLHEIISRAHPRTKGYPYRNFTIKKRSGGFRWISVPIPPLMAAQTWIARNILNQVAPHNATYSYVLGKRVKGHASRHCGADWLIKVDIKDFFGNISERQVFDVFRSLGYPNLLSFEMARLCTRITPKRRGKRWRAWLPEDEPGNYYCPYIGSLPQGAPTSPALSNLVCRRMDEDLEEFANKYGATYSRYADDLCFSLVDSSRAKAFELKKGISKVLWDHSFSENPKKTQIIPPGARKILTGLIVNEKVPTIPKEVRDGVRMHLYFCRTRGIPNHCENRGFRSVIGFRNHLYGLIRYVNSVDRNYGAKFLVEFGALPWLDFDI